MIGIMSVNGTLELGRRVGDTGMDRLVPTPK